MTEKEFTVTQPDGAHRITATEEEDSYLIYCEECGKLVRYGHKVFEVLVRGDQEADHSYTIIGNDMNLTIGFFARVRTESDKKVEDLLGDIVIDL